MPWLPAELLASAILSRLDARSLSCVALASRAVHRLATADAAWRALLLAQGFTAQGLALWQGEGEQRPSLMKLFAFADRYHEALEFEVLSHRHSSFHATLEFCNPWSTRVFTFFASHRWPAEQQRVADGEGDKLVETVQLDPAGESCCAEGFAVSPPPAAALPPRQAPPRQEGLACAWTALARA